MSDPLEEIEKKEENFMRRHVMECYKSYVNNKHRKGLYIVHYDCIEEALNKFDFVYTYVMDTDMLKTISLMSPFECDIGRCYDEYDPDMQVMICISIGEKSYFQICEYSLEEARSWLEHIDCREDPHV
jgi:hypothetical protein